MEGQKRYSVLGFLHIVFLWLVAFSSIQSATPEAICNVFADVLQTRKDPSQIDRLTDGGLLSYIHNTDDCQLNTGYVWSDEYGHGLKCDDGTFSTATGNYATSIDVDYSFSVTSADTDSSPASTTGWFAASDKTVTHEDEILSSAEYDTIDQDYHNYSFSLTAYSDKAINTFDEIMHTVTIKNLDGHDLEIGSFKTKGYDSTSLLLEGEADNVKIDSIESQGSNQFFTALEAKDRIDIGTMTLGSSSSDTVTIRSPKVVIDELDSSNDDADIVIYADEIDIGSLTLSQNNRLTIYPYTAGNRVVFHNNTLATSSSASIVLSSGDYYIKDLSVPGTGNGEKTIIAKDASSIVNLIIDGSVDFGNNPGINSDGNNGNFGSLPPANFRMFINGDLTTGGGGTTFNALVYVEGKTDLGSPTYLRGALSSYEDIKIGNDSHFYKDSSTDDAGWGECGGADAPEFDNQYSCGVFDSVLVSYEHITMGQNDVYNACEISVKDLNFDEDTRGVDVTCYKDEGSTKCSCTESDDTNCSNDGTCTIIPEPKNRYSHTFVSTTLTDSTTTSDDVTFTELEYGNYTFDGNNGDDQQIYFNPQESYADNDTKVMLLGDFQFAGNGQTLTFEAGDYYFKSFKIDQDGNGNINQVNICAKDDIRIFVHGDFIYSGNHLNNESCGGKIFVYVEGDAIVDSNGGGSSDIPLFLYTEGDVKIEPSGDASKWVGSITAEGEIDISKGNSTSNFNFYYDDSADAFGLGECQMCYTDIYVGGFTFGFGDCPGFSFNLFSDIRVPIEASDALSNVTVNEAHTGSAFSFSWMKNQEVIDQDGNHVRDAQSDSSSVLNAGAFGMEVGLFQDEVVTYPLGDDNGNYGPTDDDNYQQLHSSTLIGFDMCKWAESLVYVAHYDDGDKHYDVALSQCEDDDNNGGGSYISGPFDAWDTFRDDAVVPPSDRNISTKLISEDFNLSLASLNKTNNAYETKYGEGSSVEVAIYDLSTLKAVSNAITFDANTTAHIHESENFQVNQAIKQAVVGFRLCATFDDEESLYYLYPSSDCSGDNYDCNATTEEGHPIWHICYARDSFAIRPKEFAIINSNNGNIAAGVDFNLTLRALDSSGNVVKDYNETMVLNGLSSPTLNDQLDNPSCATQDISSTPESVSFVDGEANVTLNYSGVGALNFELKEVQGSEFAMIDNDDTDYNSTTDDTADETGTENGNMYYREIEPSSTVINFIPDHFQIVTKFNNFHTSSDSNFTYISSDLNMSAFLDIDVIAKNASDEITPNYNNVCYATQIDTNLTFIYSSLPVNLSKIYYLIQDREDRDRYYYYDTDPGVDIDTQKLDHTINTTAIFPSDADHNGTAYLRLNIGFDRSNNQVENPFELNATVYIEDENNVQGIQEADTNTTFVYARVRATKDFYDDIKTSSVTTPIKIEVYCDRWPASESNCPGVSVIDGATNNPRWFISTAHDMASSDGNIVLSIDNEDMSINDNTPDINTGDNGIDNTIQISYTGSSLPAQGNVNMNANGTSSWLIYTPSIYKVRFIDSATWSGVGQTGNVVGTGVSTKKSNRLDW